MELPRNRVSVDRSWLLIEHPDNPAIRVDARFLDRVFADDDALVLAVGDETFTLEVAEGTNVASGIAERLAPYTRSAQITRSEVYEDAKRRLELASRGRRDNGAFALYVGGDDVFTDSTKLMIGKFKCLISDVELYAKVNASLPLPNGELPAGLVMLVIAARQRVEDLDLLARRVSDYETRRSDEWT